MNMIFMSNDTTNKIIEFFKKPEVLLPLAFFIVHLPFLNIVSIADEGTHTLISFFLKEFIANFISNPSISGAYSFAMNFLVHTPKLSLYYMPLFHVIGSILMYVSQSFFVTRIENLVISTLSIFFMYKLAYSFTKNKNIALWASLFLFLSPLFNLLSINSLTDNFLILAGLILSYVWFGFLEEGKYSKLFVTIVSLILLFSRMQIVLVFLAIIIYAVVTKKFKKAILPLVITGIIFLIYMLILYNLGILSAFWLSSVNAFDYERADVLSPDALLFYVNGLSIYYITPGIILLSSYILFTWVKDKKRTHWQLFLLILLLVNMFFMFTRNREIRYPYIAIIPFVIAAAQFVVTKVPRNILRYALIAFMIISCIAIIAPQYSKQTPVDYSFLSYMNETGNVLVASEKDEFFSSVIMFEYVQNHGLDRLFYRPCSMFDDRSDLIINRTKYVIMIDPPSIPNVEQQQESMDKIRNDKDMSLIYNKETPYGNISLFKNLNYNDINNTCNYVCSTKSWVCV